MTTILALDQGTTSSRAVLLHQDGSVLATAHREFAQHFPAPGWVEHDPRDLLRTTVDAAREVLSRSGEIPVALGITNQRETVMIWERATGEPVGPAIVWQDRRTTARCAALKALGVEAMVRERTGLVLDPYFSATKLEWMLARAGLRARAERGELAAGTVDTWLISRLAGNRPHLTDPTNASRTLLFDLHSAAWDPELLSLFGVPRGLLADIVPSRGVVAETDPAILGRSIPIAGIAGDQQAALFGQGCAWPGSAKNTYGTGAFLLLFTGDKPPPPGPGLLATAACGPGGGLGYALEGSVFIAGAAMQWLRDGLGLLPDAASSEAMARSVPDTGGVHFVPAFVGLGSPHWEPDARGTITGLTRGTTKAHLVRAALEAMAFSSRDLLEGMLRTTDLDMRRLRVDGGATANDWLMQFQADVLGVPVERPDVVETTALGAAALAGLAVGVWPSLEEFVSARRYAIFEPQAPADRREAWLRSWNRAVSTALHWARERDPGGEID